MVATDSLSLVVLEIKPSLLALINRHAEQVKNTVQFLLAGWPPAHA